MNTLKNCFIFGKIGFGQKKLVFDSNTVAADTPHESEHTIESPKTSLEIDTEASNQQLQNKINEVQRQINTILNNQSSSPAKKEAAQKAKEELDRIKQPTYLSQTGKAEIIKKVSVILDYYEKIQPVAQKIERNRKKVEEKLPLLQNANKVYQELPAMWQAAGINQDIINQYTVIHQLYVADLYKVLGDNFPKTFGKESVSLDDYAKDQSAIQRFTQGLDQELALLNNANTMSTLTSKLKEKRDEIGEKMSEIQYTVRLDAGNDLNKTKHFIDQLYNYFKNKLGGDPSPNQNKLALTYFQDLCNQAKNNADAVSSNNSQYGIGPNILRTLILAKLQDDLQDYYDKIQSSNKQPTQQNAYTRLNGDVKRLNLSADQINYVTNLLGIDTKVLESAATEDKSKASPAPPVAPGSGPVLPAAPEKTPAQPAANLEPQQLTQQLGSRELAAIVAGAPGEYKAVLSEIAKEGEQIKHKIHFKILLSKSYVDCFYVKEANGVYKIQMVNPGTNQIIDTLKEPYKDRVTAMQEIANGVFMQRMILSALKNPAYYKAYEKNGVIDMKGQPEEIAPWTVRFRLDWEGYSDITGNPIVTATATPYGGIIYTVQRNGVGLYGENERRGMASNMDDFFRQLQHLETWAENYENLAQAPQPEQQAAIAREVNYQQMNDPGIFYAHQDRIGRPILFGLNPNGNTTDIALDWGGGLTTDPQVNPYFKMKLEPNGMISVEIKYQEDHIYLMPLPNIGQVIDAIAAYRANKKNEPYKPMQLWSAERWQAFLLNPLALPPENAATLQQTPAAASAQQPPAALAAGPGGAPAQPPAAPATGLGGAPGAQPPAAPATGSVTTPPAAPAQPTTSPASAPTATPPAKPVESSETGAFPVTMKLNQIKGMAYVAIGVTNAWNADELVNNARANIVIGQPIQLDKIAQGHAALQIYDMVLGQNNEQIVQQYKPALLKALFQQYSVDELIKMGHIVRANTAQHQQLFVIKDVPEAFRQYMSYKPRNGNKSNLEIIAAIRIYDIRNDTNAQQFFSSNRNASPS